jgi:ribonuclease III
MEIKDLMQRIGYTFNDQKLLVIALTHCSFASDHNERLEFLGDAILSMVVADFIYHTYGRADEGQLSLLRAKLVNGENLAKVAKRLEIGKQIRLGQGEIKTKGYTRHSILANVMEALIGAVYLDRNLEECKKCIINWLELDKLDKYDLSASKDCKTKLQEFLQGQKLPLPIYNVSQISTEHDKQSFNAECSIPHYKILVTGTGPSRRKAEQNAAELCIEKLDKAWQENDQ